MSIGSNNGLNFKIARDLGRAQDQRGNSMERLASGSVFVRNDPQAASRAIVDQMDFRLRTLSASKRNINDAVSMFQTAEGGLNEINNIILRMKELAISGATASTSDNERRYLLIEYEALHDELNRIAQTNEFNGIPLLNGDDERTPEDLTIRIGDAFLGEDQVKNDDDINILRFDDFQSIVATTVGLGLRSAGHLISGGASNGIALDDMLELIEPDTEDFSNIFDQALHTITEQRTIFGSMQRRLQHAMDYANVYQENISAARSNLADTNYAHEVTKLTQANILMQAASSMLSQSQLDTNTTLNLLATVIR